MIVVGIDCGLRGAIVALTARGALLSADTAASYVDGAQYRDHAMCTTFARYYALGPALVVIEEQHSRPGEGHRSVFTTGMGFGLWRGITAYAASSRAIVDPRRWQAVAHKGAPGASAKARSLHVARMRVRGLEDVENDGIADAACMCLYARHVLGLEAAA